MSMRGLYICLIKCFFIVFCSLIGTTLDFAKIMQCGTCKEATMQGPTKNLPLNKFKCFEHDPLLTPNYQ